MCLAGTVVTSWSLTQQVAGSILFTVMTNFYRPQRSWGKVIFSETCVKNSVHKWGSAPLHAGIHAPRSTPLQEQPPATPRSRHPQRSACWEIRATSGLYESYWNAFLFVTEFSENV